MGSSSTDAYNIQLDILYKLLFKERCTYLFFLRYIYIYLIYMWTCSIFGAARRRGTCMYFHAHVEEFNLFTCCSEEGHCSAMP